MMFPIPKYYIDKKERFMEQCRAMGLDHYQVQDFIEGKGVVEMEPNIILDQINNMNYVNVLKMMPMMPVAAAP